MISSTMLTVSINTKNSSEDKKSHEQSGPHLTSDDEKTGETKTRSREVIQEEESTTNVTIWTILKSWQNQLVLVLTPIVFLPLLISSRREIRCAFCVCVIAVYWMTEALPLAVTAMFPVILYPITGVMSSKDVAQQYINDTNFLFIGGLIVAVAIENSNLHKRLALFVLNQVGSNLKCIMFGLIVGTAFLSMFISNTATTAMMVPLVQSLIEELVSTYKRSQEDISSDMRGLREMSTGLVLCICISANIGGTGMLTGTPSNLILVGQLPELFGNEASMDYVEYMVFAFPLMCICLTAAWGMLTFFFLSNAPPKNEQVSRLLKRKYRDLPRMSFDEKMVLICFVFLLFLWIFKDPGFMPGYGVFLRRGYFSDTTSVMIIAIILFALPKEKPVCCNISRRRIRPSPPLINWPVTQSRVPWNVVILLGGGFALAAGVKDSGLSAMIGRSLSAFHEFPLWVTQLFTMTITLIITNFCSNVSTASIFVPLVATMATEIKVHPFNLMLPVTIMSSFTFILPAGTAPNAIVFGSGMVSIADMAGSGCVLSILCLVLTLFYMKTIAFIVLPLSEFPSWARPRNMSGSV